MNKNFITALALVLGVCACYTYKVESRKAADYSKKLTDVEIITVVNGGYAEQDSRLLVNSIREALMACNVTAQAVPIAMTSSEMEKLLAVSANIAKVFMTVQQTTVINDGVAGVFEIGLREENSGRVVWKGVMTVSTYDERSVKACVQKLLEQLKRDGLL